MNEDVMSKYLNMVKVNKLDYDEGKPVVNILSELENFKNC